MSQEMALLVIDVQVGQVERGVDEDGGVLSRISGLIERARLSQSPVIYIQHDGEEGGPLAVGGAGWRIWPEIAPAEGELVIRKTASDSFYETGLESVLNARDIRRLIVVGFRTEYCVDTTCRRATSLGFDVTLAADAHSTTPNEVLQAAQIIAHHNATLDDFGNDLHVVTIKPASEIEF